MPDMTTEMEQVQVAIHIQGGSPELQRLLRLAINTAVEVLAELYGGRVAVSDLPFGVDPAEPAPVH